MLSPSQFGYLTYCHLFINGVSKLHPARSTVSICHPAKSTFGKLSPPHSCSCSCFFYKNDVLRFIRFEKLSYFLAVKLVRLCARSFNRSMASMDMSVNITTVSLVQVNRTRSFSRLITCHIFRCDTRFGSAQQLMIPPGPPEKNGPVFPSRKGGTL